MKIEEIKNLLNRHKKKFIIGVCAFVLVLAGIGLSFLLKNAATDIKQEETVKKQSLLSSVKGIRDLYVEQNLKDVDWLQDVEYDKKVVKEITVNDKEVDLTKTGEYGLVYKIKAMDEKMKAEEKVITVTVVDTKEIAALEKKGEDVWRAAAAESKKTADKKSDPKESKSDRASSSDTKSSSNGSTETSSAGDTGNTSSGNSFVPSFDSSNGSSSNVGGAGSESSSGSGSSGSSVPSGHWEQRWVETQAAWTETVEEPIYEMQVVWYCNSCGEDITSDPEGHLDATRHAGYRNDWKQVQVGTNTYTIDHPAEGYWENVWVD